MHAGGGVESDKATVETNFNTVATWTDLSDKSSAEWRYKKGPKASVPVSGIDDAEELDWKVTESGADASVMDRLESPAKKHRLEYIRIKRLGHLGTQNKRYSEGDVLHPTGTNRGTPPHPLRPTGY